MKFICTGCGLCCKSVGPAIENAKKSDSKDPMTKELKKFPYSAKEDGSCENLSEDGKCLVYDKRPLICNVEALYDKYYKGTEEKKDYFIRNNRICNNLIKASNLPNKYEINLNQY